MRFVFIFFSFISFIFPLYAGEIKAIRTSAFQKEKVRLVLDLTAKTEAKVFRLQNPSRLVIDFPDTKFSSAEIPAPISFITGIRLGTPQKNTCRIVLDIPNKDLQENHFFLPPQSGKPWRFVIDIISSNSQTYSKGLTPFSKTKKTKIIVLDPGHGGKDPGAISQSKKSEKHLTLLFATEMRKKLEKKGYTVFMTRSTDTAIPLRKRIEKAHKHKADLFISIHADSAKNKSARGLSVYTISEKASDAEAAALAERENKADIILGIDLEEYQDAIGNILIDLAKRDAMDKSAMFAELFVNDVKEKVNLKATPHRFAGSVVLKSPNIPSVLLEIGYLSNKKDEKLLQTKSYRSKLIDSLAKSIDTYFMHIGEE